MENSMEDSVTLTRSFILCVRFFFYMLSDRVGNLFWRRSNSIVYDDLSREARRFAQDLRCLSSRISHLFWTSGRIRIDILNLSLTRGELNVLVDQARGRYLSPSFVSVTGIIPDCTAPNKKEKNGLTWKEGILNRDPWEEGYLSIFWEDRVVDSRGKCAGSVALVRHKDRNHPSNIYLGAYQLSSRLKTHESQHNVVSQIGPDFYAEVELLSVFAFRAFGCQERSKSFPKQTLT